MSHEFNFIKSGSSTADLHSIFGPLIEDQEERSLVHAATFQPDKTDGPFIVVEPHWTMAHIMVAAGIFPSAGQARRNGWNIPIAVGYSEFTATKRKVRIFIWNPTE